MLVRKATTGDFDAVQNIMNQVQDLHVKWRPDIYKDTAEVLTKDDFLAAVADGTFYVAEDKEKVVGVMGIQYRHIETPCHVTRDVIYIDSMAVDEPYRGTGVGHAFFDQLKKMAKERKADGIELQVNARNKLAYEMYSKCGFREKSINMELVEW